MFFSKKGLAELQEKNLGLLQQLESVKIQYNKLEKSHNILQEQNRELSRQNTILKSVLLEERGQFSKLEAEKNAEIEDLQLALANSGGLLERLNAELSSLHKNNADLQAKLNFQELEKAEKVSKQFDVDYSAKSIAKTVETFFADYPLDACRMFAAALQTHINEKEQKKQREIEEKRQRVTLLKSIINLCKVISNGAKLDYPLVSLLRECGADVSQIESSINKVKVSEIAKNAAVRIQANQINQVMDIGRHYKQERRDTIIRNLYQKYGEDMFLEEYISILKENFQKSGMEIEDLSLSKIKQICRK